MGSLLGYTDSRGLAPARMRPSEGTPPGTNEVDDGLAAQREQIMYLISIATVVAFLPFTIFHFLQGNYALGALTLSVLLIVSMNSAAVFWQRRAPITSWVILIPMVPAVTISLRTHGISGAFWCYPVVLFFYFVLPRRVANACSAALLGAASFIAHRYIGTGVSTRFFVSLTLTIIIVNIVLNIIETLQRRLLRQAIEDPLTGAFNRRHMDVCLIDTIARHTRTQAPASMLLFDIDHFKHINDQFGHAVGDIVLKRLVGGVGGRSRRLDLLFRAGGEEFVLLLPDTRLAEAILVAEHLRALVAESLPLPGSLVTVSVGVSELHAGDTLDTWMNRADEALYLAKKTGRNRVVSSSGTATTPVYPTTLLTH